MTFLTPRNIVPYIVTLRQTRDPLAHHPVRLPTSPRSPREGNPNADRDRILRHVRLRTACPQGAGPDPRQDARRRHCPAQVRRRRLRDHGGRQARLVEKGNRPLPHRRGSARLPRLTPPAPARGACRVTAATLQMPGGCAAAPISQARASAADHQLTIRCGACPAMRNACSASLSTKCVHPQRVAVSAL